MIDHTAISRIASLGASEIDVERRRFKVGEAEYFFDGKEAARILPEAERALPVRKPVLLHTLAGLVAYIKTAVDDTNGILHVESESKVSLIGPLLGFQKQRETIALVEYTEESHGFGEESDIEDTLVWLRSRCVPTPEGEALIKCLGNVTDGATKTVVDDGFTQQVTVKAGATMAGADKVKSPVLLAPYRTFREVAQPISEFVVRLRSSSPFPYVTVHEADGGAWRLDAIKKIVKYLKDELPDRHVIG
jgi:hypothetical protein